MHEHTAYGFCESPNHVGEQGYERILLNPFQEKDGHVTWLCGRCWCQANSIWHFHTSLQGLIVRTMIETLRTNPQFVS